MTATNDSNNINNRIQRIGRVGLVAAAVVGTGLAGSAPATAVAAAEQHAAATQRAPAGGLVLVIDSSKINNKKATTGTGALDKGPDGYSLSTDTLGASHDAGEQGVDSVGLTELDFIINADNTVTATSFDGNVGTAREFGGDFSPITEITGYRDPNTGLVHLDMTTDSNDHHAELVLQNLVDYEIAPNGEITVIGQRQIVTGGHILFDGTGVISTGFHDIPITVDLTNPSGGPMTAELNGISFTGEIARFGSTLWVVLLAETDPDPESDPREIKSPGLTLTPTV
ncbi:MAG: hypothetical protein AAGF73_14550 [Actinomycetota bacterium]